MRSSNSDEWYRIFMHSIPSAQTEREVSFITAQLGERHSILDVPSGTGRHTKGLAERGRLVVTADIDPRLLRECRPALSVCCDMYQPPFAQQRFDAVLCIWHSFGAASAEGNAALLREWRALVRPGGLLLLDIYHRLFFEARQGKLRRENAGTWITEEKVMRGDRLSVILQYDNSGESDSFEWQLFTPEEMRGLAARCGWTTQLICSDFDVQSPASADKPRVQYVFLAE